MAHIEKDWKSLNEQTAAQGFSLLSGNQLESSRLQSPGTLWPWKKIEIHEESSSSQSEQLMIAIMMMIEMMNQSTSRARVTLMGLTHLLFLAIRTPACPVSFCAWDDQAGNLRGWEAKPVWENCKVDEVITADQKVRSWSATWNHWQEQWVCFTYPQQQQL